MPDEILIRRLLEAPIDGGMGWVVVAMHMLAKAGVHFDFGNGIDCYEREGQAGATVWEVRGLPGGAVWVDTKEEALARCLREAGWRP